MAYRISYPKLFVFTLLLLFIVPQPVEARGANPLAVAGHVVKKVVSVAVKTAVKSVNGVFRGIGSFLRGLFKSKHKAVIKVKNKTHQTYTKINLQSNKVYTGRTSGLGTPKQNVSRRDTGHHVNQQGYGPAVLDKSSSSKNAIRGREQQMIEHYGGAKSTKGTSGNKINGIAHKNPKKDSMLEEAKKEFNK